MSTTAEGTSSAGFQQKTYDDLKKEITDTAKKIKNYDINKSNARSLPKDPTERAERIDQYKKEIIGT